MSTNTVSTNIEKARRTAPPCPTWCVGQHDSGALTAAGAAGWRGADDGALPVRTRVSDHLEHVSAPHAAANLSRTDVLTDDGTWHTGRTELFVGEVSRNGYLTPAAALDLAARLVSLAGVAR
jgi:hypothetical protein